MTIQASDLACCPSRLVLERTSSHSHRSVDPSPGEAEALRAGLILGGSSVLAVLLTGEKFIRGDVGQKAIVEQEQ